ncbi:MAG: transposase [Deltaproteobacteria bacterium]|nr:transposase [Deltaproteobacteria bacterium]
MGIAGSRKIEQVTYHSVSFRVLCADQHPDHDTTASFRKRHLQALSGLFAAVLRLCRGRSGEAGSCGFGWPEKAFGEGLSTEKTARSRVNWNTISNCIRFPDKLLAFFSADFRISVGANLFTDGRAIRRPLP